MPGMPPNQVLSMLSTLMAATRGKSAAFIRMIHNNNNKLEIDNVDDGDDDDFMLLEDC